MPDVLNRFVGQYVLPALQHSSVKRGRAYQPPAHSTVPIVLDLGARETRLPTGSTTARRIPPKEVRLDEGRSSSPTGSLTSQRSDVSEASSSVQRPVQSAAKGSKRAGRDSEVRLDEGRSSSPTGSLTSEQSDVVSEASSSVQRPVQSAAKSSRRAL